MSAPDFFDYDEGSETGAPDFFGDMDQPQVQQQPQQFNQQQQAPIGYQPLPSPMQRTPGQNVADEVHQPGQIPQELSTAVMESPDFFSESPQPQKGGMMDIFKPKPYGKSPVYAEDKTPEQIKAMTASERFQYAQDLLAEREYRQSKGFTKGALSGATFGLSEKIPGLKPEEGEFLVGFGDFLGSTLPIAKLYNILGKPLVSLAAKSPKMAGALESFARMMGFGVTGATHKVIKETIKEGEMPTAQELLKEGATWVAIDAAMQALGLGAQFGQSVRNIAEAEGVPAKEVLGRLWNASKNFIKSKYGRSVKGEILPKDAEVLFNEVKKAEAAAGVKETIEVSPEKVERPGKPKPTEVSEHQPVKQTPKAEVKAIPEKQIAHEVEKPVSKQEQLSIPENAVLTKPENISIGAHGEKGTASVSVAKIGEGGKEYYAHENIPVTKEEQQLIDGSNSWSKAGDQKESSSLAQRAREMIYDRLKGKGPVESKVNPEELQAKKTTQKPPAQTAPLRPSPMGHKQAVSRSKIIDLFKTAFNDPIRLGKFKQRAAGIHKLWPKVTRLLQANDVETAAHEIGHNLHETLYGGDAKTPLEQAKNVAAALRPYLDELKPLAHYEPFEREGFAEFTRMYVTNPDVARDLAPKFYAKFEADLEAQYPEMRNALLEARDYYDSYLQGTPQSRIRAQTSYGQDKGKLANIIDTVKKNLDLDFLKTQFLDDVYPAKRLVAEAFGIPVSEVENLKDERNLYRSLRVLKGAVGKGDVFVLHETFNTKLEKVNGSLRDILKQLPNEEAYREFNDYLIARRSIEKYDQRVATGIEFGDAITVEKDLRDKYGKLAKELDKYNDTLLQYGRDAGLLSPQQYSDIKQKNLMYVPFQRVMEKKAGVSSGAGKLQAGKITKKMKGSTRDIIAPVESVLKNTYSILINAEKNLSGQVLAKIAKMKNMGAYVEEVPTPVALKAKISRDEIEKSVLKHLKETGQGDLLAMDEEGKMSLRPDLENIIPDLILKFGTTSYPAGENIISVYFDGKPKYYEVSPELYEMWTKGIAPYTAGLLTKILRIPASYLRAGAILNPKFMMKNIVRDTWGSWLFTKYGKSIKDPVGLFIDTLYSPLSMLSSAAGKSGLYVEWMKSGGGMSTMQSLDREAVTKKLDEVRKGIQPHQVIKWLRQTSEISEEVNRLSEFGKALEVEGKTRLGREISAFAARDLSVDFAKIGLQTKMLNQIIPFFNATVQGGDKLLRTLGNAKDRKDFLPRILGFIVIPSLILAWLNKDDDNIKEFYEEEKDFNFITSVNGQYIKIPVPFETGVLAHGLTQRMYSHFVKNDPEAFEQFMGSILSAMCPNFIPTAGLPFIEAWSNKSFFTDSRIIPRAQEDLVSRYQYKNNTSTSARLLGRAMTYMLGQDTRSKAASPAIIDHFINSWTGGLGKQMINISDAVLESAGLGDKIPGVGQTILERSGFDAFTTRFPRASTRSIEKFYDNYADATSRVKSFKHAEKMDIGTGEEREEAYQRIEKIYDYPTLQRAYKAIQSCQKEINNIYNDPSIEPELKTQMIDDLYLQMIEFARVANEDIREHRLNQ